MYRTWPTLTLALTLTATPTTAEQPPTPLLPDDLRATAEALRDGALEGTRAFELTRSLVVEVGPRFAGTEADRRAVEWGLRTLRELGFENLRAEPVAVPRWVRGEERGEIVAPFPQPVVLTALGGSVGTPEGGLEAEVVEAAGLEELAELPAEAVEGKIVFLNKRMERRRDGSSYMETVPIRTQGPVAAGRKGATGLLIRSVGTSTSRIAHTGGTSYEEGVPKIPAAALSNADADLLAAQIATGEPVRFRLELGARTLPDAESANVVGEIPGTDRADEIVLLACHLDSWDITPGANDDAVGCGMMIETARLVAAAEPGPRRTLRVVLYGNEEFGLSGAHEYAARHEGALGRHVIAMEADFGSGRVWRFDTWVSPSALPLADQIWTLLAPLGIERGHNRAFGGADLIPLRPHRVPVFGLLHDGSHYFDVHHTIDDTLDKVDPDDVDFNVAAYVTLAYLAATLEPTFGRGPAEAE